MNPYLALGTIVVCITCCVGIVMGLASAGIPVWATLMTVYLAATVWMLSIQRRARRNAGSDADDQRYHEIVPQGAPSAWRSTIAR